MVSLKKDKISLRKNSSIFFIGFLAASVLGLMFFLSSGFIFEEEIPVLATELNKEKSVVGNGKVKINSWVYDNKKDEMEITIVTKDMVSIDDEIVFEAFQRNGESQELETKKIYNEDGIFIIKIFEVSKEFQQVALDIIRIKENEFADTEGFEEEEKEVKELISTIYTDQRKVKHDEIEIKTDNEYSIYLADVLIKDAENEYNELQKNIKKEKEKQKKLEVEIEKNKQNMIYETGDDKLETESIVNGYQVRIDDSKQNITELQAQGKLLQEKISKLELRKREIDLSAVK